MPIILIHRSHLYEDSQKKKRTDITASASTPVDTISCIESIISHFCLCLKQTRQVVQTQSHSRVVRTKASLVDVQSTFVEGLSVVIFALERETRAVID